MYLHREALAWHDGLCDGHDQFHTVAGLFTGCKYVNMWVISSDVQDAIRVYSRLRNAHLYNVTVRMSDCKDIKVDVFCQKKSQITE